MRIASNGIITLSAYGAGYLKTDANGVISVDTDTIEDTLQSVTDRGATTTNAISVGGITSSGASSGRYTGLEVVNTTNAGGTETAIGLGVVTAANSACDVKLVANRVGANSGSDFYIEQTNSSGTQIETFRIAEDGNATFEGDVEVNGNLVVDGAGVSTDFQLRRSVNAAALLTINAPGGSPNGSVFSINGSSVMTLDENQKATFAGDVQVDGDLIVTGNTTSVNVEDLNVEQGEITLNYAASSDTSSSANGAGIRIQDAVDASNDATILWDQPNLEFDFSHGASFAGQVETKNNAGIYSFSDTVNASSSEDIFTLSNSHGAQAFRVTFVCNTSGFSVAKTFEVVHQFAGTPVFAKVVDTGAYSSNDFSVAFANDNDQGMKCTITNASTTINADIVTTVFLGGSPTDITVTEL
jgi:hypothetical protein